MGVVRQISSLNVTINNKTIKYTLTYKTDDHHNIKQNI